MSHPLEYVIAGALMQCSQGTVPMPFKTTPRTSKIAGMMAGNALDKLPLVNIPSFVICQKLTQLAGGTPTPCVPAPTLWQDTYPAKVGGADTLLFRSCINCPVGQGQIEFLTSGQLPLPPAVSQDLKAIEQEAKESLEAAEREKNSVGEASFAEGLIPIWGSGRDLIHSVQTGNTAGMVLNGAFLVWDVLSVGAGILSFGTATAAMMAGKAGVRATLKAGGKVALGIARKKLVATAAKAAALKKALPAALKAFSKKVPKLCVTACFPAGTPVAVADGYKNIEDIVVGDEVWAWHEETGDLALKAVTQTLRRQADALVELQLGSDTLRATPEHPFWVNSGWKLAGDLVKGDTLLRSDGQAMALGAVVHHTEQPTTVYNLEVADWHTYLVSWWMFVVHNATVCLTLLAKETKAKLARWLGGLKKRGANYGKPNARAYQVKHCGPEETLLHGNGHEVWADGVDEARGVAVDAKHIEDASKSPFVETSNVPPFIREKIDREIRDEMYRYGEVIKDGGNDLQALEIVTNEQAAVPYFEKLIDEFGINGGVVVKP
jgi:hypothetical protein